MQCDVVHPVWNEEIGMSYFLGLPYIDRQIDI